MFECTCVHCVIGSVLKCSVTSKRKLQCSPQYFCMSILLLLTFFSFLLTVYSMPAQGWSDNLSASAIHWTSSQTAGLELGLLWCICILPCALPSSLDCLPAAWSERHAHLQAGVACHSAQLQGDRRIPGLHRKQIVQSKVFVMINEFCAFKFFIHCLS